MKFHFSKENLNKPQAKLQRSLEILPGACSWSVLLGLIFLSIFFPFSAAILIVAFYLSWIMRVLYSTIFLLFSYLRLNIEKNTDWMHRIHGIDNLPIYSPDYYLLSRAVTDKCFTSIPHTAVLSNRTFRIFKVVK